MFIVAAVLGLPALYRLLQARRQSLIKKSAAPAAEGHSSVAEREGGGGEPAGEAVVATGPASAPPSDFRRYTVLSAAGASPEAV